MTNFFRITKIASIVFSILAIGTINIAKADENGERVMYVGSGTAKTGNDKAYSIGFMKISNSNERQWGADVGGEGTMHHNGSPETANSVNLLVGSNFGKSDFGRLDGAFLIGIRGKSSSCPASNLGFRCYADQDPSVKFGLNYGVVMTWSYKSILVGIRATGESKQALLGFRF